MGVASGDAGSGEAPRPFPAKESPLGLSHANAVLFDDPKPLVGALGLQRTGELSDCPKDVVFPLASQPKHDDARSLPRRVRTYVREVRVCGDENPVLLGTDSSNDRIAISSEALNQNGGHVMAGFGEKICRIARQVLVELAPHARGLSRRYAQNPFTSQLRGISERRWNALRLQRRVAGQDLVGMDSSGEVVENHRDHHPRPLEAGLPVADLWIHRDVLLPSHRVGSSVAFLTGVDSTSRRSAGGLLRQDRRPHIHHRPGSDS